MRGRKRIARCGPRGWLSLNMGKELIHWKFRDHIIARNLNITVALAT